MPENTDSPLKSIEVRETLKFKDVKFEDIEWGCGKYEGSISFDCCEFSRKIDLSCFTLNGQLTFTNCVFLEHTEIDLSAAELRGGLVFQSKFSAGSINLGGARIGRRLIIGNGNSPEHFVIPSIKCVGCSVSGVTEIAVRGNDLFLTAAKFSHLVIKGLYRNIHLSDATIEGSFDIENLTIAENGIIEARSLRIAGDLKVGKVNSAGCGAITLDAAQIPFLRFVAEKSSGGNTIIAPHCTVSLSKTKIGDIEFSAGTSTPQAIESLDKLIACGKWIGMQEFLASMEQLMRSKENASFADSIFRLRRRHEARSQGIFYWFVSKFWDMFTKHGTSIKRPLFFLAALLVATVFLFTDPESVQHPVSFPSGFKNANSQPLEWVTDQSTQDAAEWNLSNAFVMAVRNNIPYLDIQIGSDWEPSDRQVVIELYSGKSFATGILYSQAAAVIRIMNLPLIFVFATQVVRFFRKKE